MADASRAEATAAAADFSDEIATFGDRLAHAREAMGLDPGQLALRLGVKLQTLRNWEEDRSEPRANRLQMLAGLLNVSLIWLMTGQGAPPRAGGAAGRASTGPAAACVDELRQIRADHLRLGERMSRLEKRLRAMLG